MTRLPYRTADIPGGQEVDKDIVSARRRLHNGWQALGRPKEGVTMKNNGVVRKMTPDERFAHDLALKTHKEKQIESRVALRRTLLEQRRRRLSKKAQG